MRRLIPVAFEQQVLGGLLLVAAALGILAVVQAERRGLAAAAVFLLGGGIYLAVVWRLQLRAGMERALAEAGPAPEDAEVEPRGRTLARSLVVAVIVCAIALGLGRLHLGGAGIVVLLGVSAVAFLRAGQVRRVERVRGVQVHRVPGTGAYATRERRVDTSLPLVAAPPDG